MVSNILSNENFFDSFDTSLEGFFSKEILFPNLDNKFLISL